MKDKGFIKLNRGFFENPFWKEERIYSLAEAWIDLIQSARFEVAPTKIVCGMKTLTINRGELRASQRYLSKRWNWSVGKVNRFIKLLEDERMIERRHEHSETIVKLCKYDTYNDFKSDEMNSNGNANGTQTEHRRNTDRYKEEESKESKEREEREEARVVNFPEYEFLEIENLKEMYLSEKNKNVMDSVGMMLSIPPKNVKILLDRFVLFLKTNGEKTKTFADFRKHFSNWVRRQDMAKEFPKQNENALSEELKLFMR